MAFVSYYDGANGDLRLALIGDFGDENCGPGNHWRCLTIDETGDVGRYSSIDYFEAGDTYQWGISYYDATNHALKYATSICVGSSCGLNIVTISDLDFADVGKWTTLKYGPDGQAHIAYYSESIGGSSLMYARSMPGGGGNCGEGDQAGAWMCDQIDRGPGIG